VTPCSSTTGGRGQRTTAARSLRAARLVCRLFSTIGWCALLAFAATSIAETPPQFAWARQSGGGTNEEIRAVAADSEGNVLVTGFFQGTATIGTSNLVSSGLEDILVAKFDPSGNFLWARRAGGTAYDEGRGIATDNVGNVYVTGLFQGTATFGTSNLTSAGQSDVFLAKYSPTGDLLWLRKAGGTDFDEAHAVAVDSDGNAYITGFIDANATFGLIALNNTSASDDMFVAKCNSSGTFVWAQKAQGASAADDTGNGIAVDAAGNVYVAGSFTNTLAFSTTNITSAGVDIFLVKYDSSGNFQWVRQAGGVGDDLANAVASDSVGNVSVVGKFQGTANFGSTVLTGNGNDIFVAYYRSGGDVVWAKRAGGNNAIYGDSGLGVVTDGATNTFVTGYFSGTASFGSSSVTSSAFDDVFCSKYDAAGNLAWVRSAGGNNLDLGYGVARDKAGNIYVGGFFSSSTIAFDGMTLTNRGGRDMFLAKLPAPPIPALSITASNGFVLLSWPATAGDYFLESAPELSGVTWSSVPDPTNIVGSNVVVTSPISGARQFYRLRK
jgi:hypothetical protein